eukprot:g1700.t1
MGDPDSENGDGGLLKYAKLVDSERFGVWGVALVMNGFKARLHFHPEDETYYFLWGEGEMIIGDGNRGDTTKRLRFSAPAKVHIPADTPHAMTPVSNYVVLLYTFPNGPFEKIPYTYLPKYVPLPDYPSRSYSSPVHVTDEEEVRLCRTSKL